MKDGQIILEEKQLLQKIKRIAFEIYEQNFSAKTIWLAGIYDQGYFFAQLLQKELKAISSLDVRLIKVKIDKKNPGKSNVELDQDKLEGDMKNLILVDDVLYTGRTLVYVLQTFLKFKIEKIETAVLVNRKYSLFPISASYTGYELATTLTDHVQVVLNEETKAVYLHD